MHAIVICFICVFAKELAAFCCHCKDAIAWISHITAG